MKGIIALFVVAAAVLSVESRFLKRQGPGPSPSPSPSPSSSTEGTGPLDSFMWAFDTCNATCHAETCGGPCNQTAHAECRELCVPVFHVHHELIEGFHALGENHELKERVKDFLHDHIAALHCVRSIVGHLGDPSFAEVEALMEKPDDCKAEFARYDDPAIVQQLENDMDALAEEIDYALHGDDEDSEEEARTVQKLARLLRLLKLNRK